MVDASIALPEFGLPEFSWAACRNPMCANFGIPFDPNDPAEYPAPKTDRHYVPGKAPERLACRNCGASFGFKPNEAIRPIARYFHSLSLPFATCPDENCVNSGTNVFEHFSRPGSRIRRRYGRNNDHQVRCLGCKSEKKRYRYVTLGTAFSSGRNAEVYRTIDAVRRAIFAGTKKRRTVFLDQIKDATYFGRLRRMGALLQDYHAWANARFLSPHIQSELEYGRVARVQTDVVDISLKRTGDVSRSRHLKLIVSALEYKNTYYILAAHPGFLPEVPGSPDKANFTDPRTGGPSAEFARRWDCLEHPVHNRFGGLPKDVHKKAADVSRFGEGFYIRSPYVEAAHFLVVRKMLSRFDNICFYMDGGPSLIQGAMVGLADGIRSRKVEVVIHQRKIRRKGPARALLSNMGGKHSEDRLNSLRSRWEGAEKRAKEHIGGYDEEKEGDIVAQLPQPAAIAYAAATKGAWSEAKWAWLRFPENKSAGFEGRTLWLTRMPGKDFKDSEEFLRYSSLQSVDSSMDAIRNWVLSATRPGNRAQKGRNFVVRYFDPRNVQAELALHLFNRNFFQIAEDQKTIPAEELGLMQRSAEDLLTDTDAIKTFRLGLAHAELMTQWLRR